MLVTGIYLFRLASIQLFDDSTKKKADSNAILRQYIYPPRGLIYDRNGRLIVSNKPIYEVCLTMREIRNRFDTLAFCQTLNIDTITFNNRIRQIKDRKINRGYSYVTPQVFLSNLSIEDIAALQENMYRFSGVSINKRTLRSYTYPMAAHLLGSVGEVSKKDLENDSYYNAGDYSGRDGFERTYEKQLRGKKGVKLLMRDFRGKIKGSYKDGEFDEDAEKGDNLTIGLDSKLQLLAERLLQGKVGSIVAIEPESGEILALASNPAWNPELLVGKQRSSNYNTLLQDSIKPLLNRATQAMYPPGSTFKTVQALVCLEHDGISPLTYYPCSGKNSLPISCTHSHGSPVSLLGAIEQSCNPYFWRAFQDMLEKGGGYKDKHIYFRERYNLWRESVMRFGLGSRFTDSDIADLRGGSIPKISFYDKYYGVTGWKAITIRSLSIGQGEILLTPLQIANMGATIANEGYYITPHILRADSMLTHRHETNIKKEYFDIVKEGMRRVMVNGTGRHFKPHNIEMAGKTGTAQAGKDKKDHSIFMGFAPVDEPKIAVAVVIENSGFGATWAGPMASLIIEQYLTDTIERQDMLERLENAQLNKHVQRR